MSNLFKIFGTISLYSFSSSTGNFFLVWCLHQLCFSLSIIIIIIIIIIIAEPIHTTSVWLLVIFESLNSLLLLCLKKSCEILLEKLVWVSCSHSIFISYAWRLFSSQLQANRDFCWSLLSSSSHLWDPPSTWSLKHSLKIFEENAEICIYGWVT